MTESEKSHFGWLLLLIVSGILLTALLIYLNYRRNLKNQSPPQPDEILDSGNIPMTDADFTDNVKSTLLLSNVPAKLITALALHESDNFRSDLFIQHNNPFGMYYPNVRDHFASYKTDMGYAGFNSVYEAIVDFGKWAEYNDVVLEDFNDPDSFVQMLKDKKYFTASFIRYLAAIKKHYDTL
jgi:hypothetical protein